MAIRKSSNSGIPFGNILGRPAANIGQPYFNGEEKRLEIYTSTGWQNIVSETPGVVSISGNYLESEGSGTITIIGTNFTTGAIASVVGTNGVEVNATSTTVNSIVSVVSVFTGLSNANEPYDIKVTNTSNLFGLLPDALYINASPVWQTASGSLGTFAEQVAMSVSATSTDDSTITYSLASGSSLPSGVTLNSSTGLISGTPPDVASNTTYTFTINASDGSNPAIPRTFSFVSNAAPIWSTSSGSLGTFNKYTNISLTVAATDISDSITYALASGSTLPSGVTLNSSTGVISGMLPDIASSTTYTFTINATDGANIIPRTFSITSQNLVSVEYLIVAGGGSGAGFYYAGGGGAGGLLAGTSSISLTNLAIVVGNGGAEVNTGSAGAPGNSGGNSSAFSLTAIGGGGGGAQSTNGNTGGSGGGAGGGQSENHYGAAGTAGQGNTGGNALQPSTTAGGYGAGGGGGGAGGVGGNVAGAYLVAGAGGLGLANSITGTSTFYAAGGGGGGGSDTTADGGPGGSSIGGNGASTRTTTGATAGAANTGSGGGGGSHTGSHSINGKGAPGGSGVVIIAYPDILPAITTIPGTLTYTQPTRTGYRVYRFTGGTGTITF